MPAGCWILLLAYIILVHERLEKKKKKKKKNVCRQISNIPPSYGSLFRLIVSIIPQLFTFIIMQFVGVESLTRGGAPTNVPMVAHKIEAPESHGGSGWVLIPANGFYNKIVIWLHGLADTPDPWVNNMPQLGLENCKFILPQARSRPVMIYGQKVVNAWSDLFGMNPNVPEDKVGIEESADRIARLIHAEIDIGINPNRIAVIGFSQGGAIALHLSLRLPFAIGGCIALNSWLPLRQEYPAMLSQGSRGIRLVHRIQKSRNEISSSPFHPSLPTLTTI